MRLIRDASPAEAEALCRSDPRYGHLVCRCEHVSEAEIVQAIHAPIPATSLDALKRRLRPGAGRCQGGFCGPRIVEILARELGTAWTEVAKAGPGSKVVVQANKAAWR
jgi:glycerol-3-phosphate dehydrogenase